MLRKRPVRFVLVFVAVAAAFAFLQMARNKREANGAVPTVSAANPSGIARQPACASTPVRADAARLTRGVSDTQSVILRLDYAGAEALMDALERESLTDADVDSLLRIRGLCAVVDNVTRFVPGLGEPEFRSEIRAFVRKKKGGRHERYFRLRNVWESRDRMRTLIAALRADERRIVEETLLQLQPYLPARKGTTRTDTASSTITAYFVAGGVSDGFIFDNDPYSFYANLVGAYGDVNGVVSNMAHEAYHAMQFAAQTRARIKAGGVSNEELPPVERLLAVTLSEGTANYAADPTRSTASGPSMDESRKRYRRHAEPKQIAADFARFDDVLKNLREGRLTWDAAYRQGFTSENDASFYFVGYQMAKAIDRYCGRECVGDLFEVPPVEFFRRYVGLYQRHPDIPGRFSPETERIIADVAAAASR